MAKSEYMKVYMQKRYQSRKAMGLCIWCGVRPARDNKILCEECAVEQGSVSKQSRIKRSVSGMCRRCGQPAVVGKTQCVVCATRGIYVDKQRKQQYIAQGICIMCGTKPSALGIQRCEECRVKYENARVIAHQERKANVIEHYGGRCECCGESNIDKLTLDHIHNNGSQHIQDIGRNALYKWAIDNGYPDDLRCLCFNCNCGRARNGGICPHNGDYRPTLQSKSSNARRQDIEDIINMYGGKCAICGEQNPLFLTVDHIGGGGRQQMREMGAYAVKQLIKQYQPTAYQILCFNCNCDVGKKHAR